MQAGCTTRRPQHSEGKETQSASSDSQSIVETITDIVAQQLELDNTEVDVDLPLSKQKKPADELDVVEIVLNVEEAFDIGLNDEDVGNSSDLSVKKLADVVVRKQSTK